MSLFSVMHKWLENFDYKSLIVSRFSHWLRLALGIALLTASWRSATKNSVEALKHE